MILFLFYRVSGIKYTGNKKIALKQTLKNFLSNESGFIIRPILNKLLAFKSE